MIYGNFQPNGYDHGNQAVVDNMLATSADHIKVGFGTKYFFDLFTIGKRANYTIKWNT